MKFRLLIIILFLKLLSISAFSQKLTHVSPGVGTLEAAVLNAEAGDTLELSGGGEYTIAEGSSEFAILSSPLTIMVEEGATEKAIISLGANANITKKYYFFEVGNGAALNLKGLEIHGLHDGVKVAASMLLFDARPSPASSKIGNFRFEDCIFHDFKDYIIHGMKADYATGLIQDSVFIDGVTVFNAKHFLQYKHVSLHHLEMTNSTIYSMQGMALKIGKIGYRCAFDDPLSPSTPTTDATITPTGFIDHCTLNDLGDIHGHIQVDDPYHTLVISNCIISHQQQYAQPPVYFNDPKCDTAGIIQNTCFWDCEPIDPALGGSTLSGYIFKDNLNYDPAYKNDSIGDFTLPNNSPLLTASTSGGQIGDLRWGVYTTVGIDNFNVEYSGYQLDQNYPNPFKGSTEISYQLSARANVNIKIFNVLGKEIASLVEETLDAGTYVVKWSAQNHKSGIYFCRMKSNDFSKTIKMVLE